MNDKIIKRLQSLSETAFKNGEVPVGAVIVFEDEIISEGYNNKEESSDVLGHAEINAIKGAAQKMGSWNLSGATLYVTLEPCDMCKTIIENARIESVYYLLTKVDNKKLYQTKYSLLDQNSKAKLVEKKKLQNFFEMVRIGKK